MNSYSQRRRNLGYLLSEASGKRPRETIALAANLGLLEAGTVLAVEAGEYKPAAAADTAVAILGYERITGTDNLQALVIARDAEVIRDELVYAADVDTHAEVATKIAELKAMDIIVR